MELTNQDLNFCTEDEMKFFLSKKQDFYLMKFKLITTTGDKKTWNWSSFFLNTYWMIYRKMYLEALIFYSVNLIISFIPFIGSILNMLLYIGLGMFGNSLYLNYINRRFKQINSADSTLRQILINKYGGTNLPLAIVISILLSLISITLIIIGLMLSA